MAKIVHVTQYFNLAGIDHPCFDNKSSFSCKQTFFLNCAGVNKSGGKGYITFFISRMLQKLQINLALFASFSLKLYWIAWTRECKKSLNIFCYTSGELTTTINKKSNNDFHRKMYYAYFQDKLWATHVFSIQPKSTCYVD